MTVSVSIIIPVLNEAATIVSNLEALNALLAKRQTSAANLLAEVVVVAEIIVVDGGSTDTTIEQARPFASQLIEAPRGRARQMNAGAKTSTGEYLLFLHADTRLPADFLSVVTSWQDPSTEPFSAIWGFFRVKLSGAAWPLRVVEVMMNWRSRLSGIGTGDQCLFVRREVFERVGGFKDIPLMEDVELCQRLKTLAAPRCETSKVETSSRKWEREGIVKTVLLMWRLRLAYFFGVAPEKLARKYYRS